MRAFLGLKENNNVLRNNMNDSDVAVAIDQLFHIELRQIIELSTETIKIKVNKIHQKLSGQGNSQTRISWEARGPIETEIEIEMEREIDIEMERKMETEMETGMELESEGAQVTQISDELPKTTEQKEKKARTHPTDKARTNLTDATTGALDLVQLEVMLDNLEHLLTLL